ncbi:MULTISPECIES: YDG/SRA domain-containing protein [Rhizobium/Agrobacterium group]|uniref:YDG/SRA domain-containing protein n=1 Tax=Rhizobium/Agrobacterium group TaxID=227290 RepID=UPI000CF9C5A6|nr:MULTISPECIES: YDG/SRA domain-containing protein [Rhizobium/Agrobacterium group]MBY3504013.1 HNH endonuclease [Rhizobium laguerreae]
MASESKFGCPDGVKVGDIFASYKEMNQKRVHRSTMGGISGTENDGADSIVISGGYADDIDFGDEIIYTGHGGRDGSGKQIKDQDLRKGNLALVRNEIEGIPVRVIRGANLGSDFAPSAGYRYDGLYRVESHWAERGLAGFQVWRFRLVLMGDQHSFSVRVGPDADGVAGGNPTPGRRTILTQRIIRDTRQAKELKRRYRYRCQVCGDFIETSAGRYAEAAHIRPLGLPHNGPDVSANILCLCPNHHVMFDFGVFTINDDHTLNGIEGRLTVRKWHNVSRDHLRYHREHFSVAK